MRLDLLEEIQNRVPEFQIVLHGASLVDAEEIKRINNAGGGLLNNAQGITEEEVKKTIKDGV